MSHPADPNCIFCKIIAGTIPNHTLHESPRVLSFLDVGPLSPGHSLVIPKGHWVTLDQVPDEILAECAAVAKVVGNACAKATGAAGWNLLQNNGKVAGQAVMHVHFHTIPRREGDGLGYRWSPKKFNEEEARDLVKSITAAM